MSYAYPAVPDLGARVRTLLATYAKAGGRDACLLLHAEDGRAAIARLARRGRGLPARVIPLEVHHVASVGLDVWLAALAHGACAGRGARDRRRGAAVPRGARAADAVRRHDRAGAGLPGRSTSACSTAPTRRRSTPRSGRGRPRWRCARRRRSRSPPTSARPRRSRSSISRSTRRCRSARSRCPPARRSARSPSTATPARCASRASAPARKARSSTAQEAPQLRFIEAKCVQCGLCAATCPEHAIALTPRLSLAPEARQPRVLNEAVIFNCIALRQAARHREDGRRHAGASSPGIRCSPRPARSTGCRCAPTAASST